MAAAIATAESAKAAVGIFDEGFATVHARFPGREGSLLQSAVMDNYVIKTNFTLPLMTSDNTPAVSRHPLNQRSHAVVKEQYVQSILTKGNVVGVRGIPWAVPAKSEGEYFLLSYGTLAEALYEALARERGNAFVQHALKLGLPGATIFHPRTPSDVLSYLKCLHNEFHAGAATSFMEVYGSVEAVEAAWNTHKIEKGITARSCPTGGEQSYEKQYWRFVNETYPKQFKHWQQWDNVKSFKRAMVKADLYDDYRRLIGARCNFLSTLLDNDAVISNNHVVVSMMVMNFAKTLKARVGP